MATAFLGPRGTFSEDAALLYAGSGELIDFSTMPALTAAVETGLATEAVLPIENSIEGAVSATLDLLIHETPLKIKAELVVPVRLFLITAPGASLNDIKVVSSHPNPLGQSRRFLERCLPKAEKVAALSTALAVEEVATRGDRSRAAIGTERSAALFGGQILAHDIQDVRSNVTRFVVLGPHDAEPSGDDKTSIGFKLKANVPGALHKVLTPLAEENIQMTKIENRPTKVWLGEYVFLIDFEGHRTDPPIIRALDQIRENCDVLKIFGSYPRFPLETFKHLNESPAFPSAS
ncbi:MAG: prephenate dehydratase [Thermomicrobiales bacterium]|jgi:prephenate dehydratase|nr:prephenate dehydratase [Thermomicrobiales bacterium]MEA2584335.1 prephenate dehydratase [Thermomicrobiales bacterium]MEA2595210.1 prephenate dehydratase [Thermomicrobiales bacterium]